MSEWIGVDLDGTLAHYEGWKDGAIGDPVPAMLERVKKWLAEGRTVKIVTARVSSAQTNTVALYNRRLIEVWCVKHIGVMLDITAEKDFSMSELWDDRCVRVMKNTGEPCCGRH